MLRIVNMTQVLEYDDFTFAVFNTVKGGFLVIDGSAVWTIPEWRDECWLSMPHDSHERVLRLAESKNGYYEGE